MRQRDFFNRIHRGLGLAQYNKRQVLLAAWRRQAAKHATQRQRLQAKTKDTTEHNGFRPGQDTAPDIQVIQGAQTPQQRLTTTHVTRGNICQTAQEAQETLI